MNPIGIPHPFRLALRDAARAWLVLSIIVLLILHLYGSAIGPWANLITGLQPALREVLTRSELEIMGVGYVFSFVAPVLAIATGVLSVLIRLAVLMIRCSWTLAVTRRRASP